MKYQTLQCEQPHTSLLIVELKRPEVANALNTEMGREILSIFQGLIMDPGDVRCVILTGHGERFFCAGGDLKERDGISNEAWNAQHILFEQAYYAIMDCPIPIIAAVNGTAFGGGCELALASDFIYAAATAKFALPELRLGLMPGCGGTQNLARAVGTRRAKELILSSRIFTAQEAKDWAMVNEVVELSELMSQVMAVAEKIIANGPMAVKQAKRAISFGAETDLKTGLALEVEAYKSTVSTKDRMEGVRAFNEKREPYFKGR